MGFSVFFPLFLFAVFFCGGRVSAEVLPPEGGKAAAAPEELVSSDPVVRKRASLDFRRRLDAEAAGDLLLRLPRMADPLRLAVADLLACGGPWMPGVLRALGRDEETDRWVARILLDSLDRRALGDEPSPLLDTPPLFAEGAAFAFAGTWPGAVPLDAFLDVVDEKADPPYPFVLDPELAREAGKSLAVTAAPPGGPAPMVIDVLLRERGLGLELLESVVMVTRGGRGALELDFEGQECDGRLMKKILEFLSSGAVKGAARRTVLRALAALDPPGFFEGYLGELSAGGEGDCLAYLLSAGAAPRLSARIALEDDPLLVRTLLRLYERDPCGPFGMPIARLLLRLPAGQARRALGEKGPLSRCAALLLTAAAGKDGELCPMIASGLAQGGEGETAASLLAARRRIPLSPGVLKVFADWLGTGPRLDPGAAALADDCLAAAAPRLGDEALARLIAAGPRVVGGGKETSKEGAILPGLLEAGKRAGGRKCFESLAGFFFAEGGGGASVLEALGSIARRIGIDSSSVETPGDADPLAASLFRMVLGGREKNLEEGAALLLKAVRGGEKDVRRVLPFFSFLAPRGILTASSPFLKDASSGRRPLPPLLRRAFIASAVAAAAGDPTAAASLRIALRKALGPGRDPLLDIALKDISRLGKPGAFTIPLRFASGK